nr:reverse transcriptase domain-containing protein [Tanacetum cinerariifolium]
MHTRRSYFPIITNVTIARRRSREQNSNVFEPEIRTIVEMADNRTMAQMLQAPIEGYEDAIIVPSINANNFELKQTLINLVQTNQFTGRQDPQNHLRFFNKVTSTFRHPEVPNTTIKLLLFPFSLEGEAQTWLDKEPPHSILTNPMKRLTKHGSILSICLASLEDKLDIRMNRFEKSLNDMKAFITPTAPIKAVEEVCVTCGANHNYNHCPLTRGGNEFPVFHDNIQQFQTAAVGNFIQGNRHQNVSNQMRPPGFNQPNQQNQNYYRGNNFNSNQNRQNNQGAAYQNHPQQTPTYQAPAQQNAVTNNKFEAYTNANDANMNNLQIKFVNFQKNQQDFQKKFEQNQYDFQNQMMIFMQNLYNNKPSSSSSLLSNTIPTPKEHSFSKGYEHPNTTPEMKSDEMIKSGVEELVPIPREYEIDNLDEFSRPLIPIHTTEEERIKREHANYINRMEIQDNDSQWEEFDIVTSTDDVLPPGVENDDLDGEIDVVDDLRIDNSISNSEHESFENEESDFDNPSVPLPHPEPPDEELDFKIDFKDEILIVRNTIVKCIDARVEFDDEDDDYSYFMFARVFSFLSTDSEDTIFDPGISI